jgi:hypothetical protein
MRITDVWTAGAGESQVMTNRPEPSTVYIRFNEVEDVVVSAELVAHLAPMLDDHPSYWKWVIVGTHSALQGAMVCALADSTGTSVLDESANKMLAWLDADITTSGDPPKENLASFNRLLNRCTSGPEPLLVLTSKQRHDIEQLHDHRTKFAHFLPHQSWSIEKPSLPPIVSAAMDAVERLVSRWPISRWPIEVPLCERQQERLSKALHDSKARLRSWLLPSRLCRSLREEVPANVIE